MRFLFQTPTSITAYVWVSLIVCVISVSGTLLGVWWTRKKPSTVKVEDDEHAARARNLEIQSIVELLQQLRDTNREVATLGRELTENRRQNSFLRRQVRYQEQLVVMERQAKHRVLNEVQRCLFAINMRDDAIRQLITMLLPVCAFLGLIPLDEPPETCDLLPPAFEIANHEELMKSESLPLPPPSLDDG